MSYKEKVASNGLRALGYYLNKAEFPILREKILSKINMSQQQLHRIQSLIKVPVTVDELATIILSNLDNKSPKIAWNACVALANILDNPFLTGEEILFSK